MVFKILSPTKMLIIQVKVNGTTKYLSFAEDGDVEHVKYEILNFDADNGYFKEVILLLFFIFNEFFTAIFNNIQQSNYTYEH